MRCPPPFAVLVLLLAAAPAWARPFEIESLERNGALSRRVWEPSFAQVQVGGVKLAAGVAIGLRGPVREQLDRRIAPALSMDLNRGGSLSLLPARDGAMLVWQSSR